ncbi:MAG: 23S rRNA (guanosine(2251)-2'-O)-methyltransferase RlmB [Tenericutes bacterium GWF2_57_13]|nr:MAG: 23S rRNA (guanosine(2251)-2'-O)-methyltransferase RlmB [Tenericutes bacterium GWF2_57_13]
MSVMIYGKNPCKEILAAGRPVRGAFIQSGTNADLAAGLKAAGIPFCVLDKKAFDRNYPGNHQGVVFEIDGYKTLTLDEAFSKHAAIVHPLYLMLDGIEDPHNLGAIIRSAEAGGVTGIIIPKDRSVGITGAVAKVASGALEYLDVIEVTNLAQTIEKLKKHGFWIVGTAMDAVKKHTDIDVSTPLCVVIGSEGKGMGRLIKDSVDYCVRIPMAGKANSLNASVAAGVIIFEILRKRG